MEVGPCEAVGMGVGTVSWQSLDLWNKGYGLSQWELRAIRLLSSAYVGQLRISDKADCPAPWIEHQTPERRQAVAVAVKRMFRT